MGGRKGSKGASAPASAVNAIQAESCDRSPATNRKRKATDLDQLQSNSETKPTSRSKKEVHSGVQQDRTHGYTGPYPHHIRPSAQECQAARDGLAALHGDPKRAALGEEKFELAKQEASSDTQARKKESWQKSVLDSLVCTILSQNTTDVNSARAFAKLKEKFPDWEMVRTANNGDIEESIKSGGLAAIKTERIRVILNTVKSERGECSLEHLRQSTDEEIKTELERFKGVGKKTIACVLMFCLDRHEFPVDTHVWRITKALGWVPAKATRDEAYAHLNARIPDPLKYDLHVLLVNHGKRCPRCAKNGQPRKASDGDCPLFDRKTAKQVLKEEPGHEQDSQVKQEAKDHHSSLVKHEGSEEEDWGSAVEQDPDADPHSVVEHDSTNEGSAETAAVKSETGTDSGYWQQKQSDANSSDKPVPGARRSSRSTRNVAQAEPGDEAVADEKVPIKAEPGS